MARHMAIGPSQETAASPREREGAPLPRKLAPARGVILGVCGGVLIWVVLIVAYVLTR